jgi:hypothetical protein
VRSDGRSSCIWMAHSRLWRRSVLAAERNWRATQHYRPTTATARDTTTAHSFCVTSSQRQARQVASARGFRHWHQ